MFTFLPDFHCVWIFENCSVLHGDLTKFLKIPFFPVCMANGLSVGFFSLGFLLIFLYENGKLQRLADSKIFGTQFGEKY